VTDSLSAFAGRYSGASTGRAEYLELRLEFVTDGTTIAVRMSGDVFDTRVIAEPSPRENFSDSWQGETDDVQLAGEVVTIKGEIRFGKSGSAVPVGIELTEKTAGRTAIVTVTEAGGPRQYTCCHVDHLFREVCFTLDVCSSAGEWKEPRYQIDNGFFSHAPAARAKQTVDLTSAFAEAGVRLECKHGPVIQERFNGKHAWSDCELHHFMRQRIDPDVLSRWPQWNVWGLLASHNVRGDAGVMFDEGPRRAPERQGFAVFRRHGWFDNLVGGAAADDLQAVSQMLYLATFVHELGHAFNMHHTKLQQACMSWTTYAEDFDRRPGNPSFWETFLFAFNDDELRHIRHGALLDVIMGGKSFIKPAGPCEESRQLNPEPDDCKELRLEVRPRPLYEFMAPVLVDVRFQNLAPSPYIKGLRVQPEEGGVQIEIAGPDGSVNRFHPVICRLGQPKTIALGPHRSISTTAPTDCFHELVDVTFGKDGFSFRTPGPYRIRAVHNGPNGRLLSEPAAFEVTSPDDRIGGLAHRYFQHDVGMAYVLGGSQSPRLRHHSAFLRLLAEMRPGTLGAADLATKIAGGIARPFHVVDDGILRVDKQANPDRALQVTQQALETYESISADRLVNLIHARLSLARASFHEMKADKPEAAKEVEGLLVHLRRRHVHEYVTKDLERRLERYR
jgi:hypothetical protein